MQMLHCVAQGVLAGHVIPPVAKSTDGIPRIMLFTSIPMMQRLHHAALQLPQQFFQTYTQRVSERCLPRTLARCGQMP